VCLLFKKKDEYVKICKFKNQRIYKSVRLCPIIQGYIAEIFIVWKEVYESENIKWKRYKVEKWKTKYKYWETVKRREETGNKNVMMCPIVVLNVQIFLGNDPAIGTNGNNIIAAD